MSGAETKSLQKEVVVDAMIDDVWNAWTTEEGTSAFFAPAANIDLRVGGSYEMYFAPDAPEGSRGGEGCVLKEIESPGRLVFSWNFPPSIPELRGSGAQTRVTVTLASQSDGKTRVKLIQTGWQNGPDWERGYAYFDRAWGVVIDRLKRRFETGPVNWENPGG